MTEELIQMIANLNRDDTYMTYDSIFLNVELSKCKSFFEWGTGYSTISACMHSNIETIYSVESNKTFVDVLSSRCEVVKKSLDEGRLKFIQPDIDKVRIGGSPDFMGMSKEEKESCRKDWLVYTRAFNDLDNNTVNGMGLVFVDGRSRVACLLNIFDVLSAGTKVLLHDGYKSEYNLIYQYYNANKLSNSLFELNKNNGESPTEKMIHDLERKYG